MADEQNVDNTTQPGDTPADSPPADSAGDTPPATGDAPPPKDGLQKRINTLTRQRREAERRAAYAEGRLAEMEARSTPADPNHRTGLDRDDFESDSEYERALSKRIKDEVSAELRADQDKAAREKRVLDMMDGHDKARAKYDDYDEIALTPGTHNVTDAMLDAAMGDNMGDILYWLGQNKSEANRIASLSPTQQAKEIGRVEAQLTAKPTPKTKTDAPEPVPKVGSNASPPAKTEEQMTREERHAKWRAEELAEYKAARGLT